MKRIVLNDTDIKLLKLVGATAGVKIYVGAVKHSIVFFTHFGAVFRNEEVEDRDSMVFVYHTRKTEGKVWIGNDHSYECKTMVNYHEMVFEITYRHFKDGWPGTLKRLGVEKSDFEEDDLPRPRYSMSDAFLQAEYVLDQPWLRRALHRLSRSSLTAIISRMTIPDTLTPEFLDDAIQLVKSRQPCEETKQFMVKIWDQYMKKHVDVMKIDFEEDGQRMVKLFKEWEMEIPTINLFNRLRLFLQCAPMLEDKNGPDAVGALVDLSNREDRMKESIIKKYKAHIRKQNAVIEQLKRKRQHLLMEGTEKDRRQRLS